MSDLRLKTVAEKVIVTMLLTAIAGVAKSVMDVRELKAEQRSIRSETVLRFDSIKSDVSEIKDDIKYIKRGMMNGVIGVSKKGSSGNP